MDRKEPILLTNRTARALHRHAQLVRRGCRGAVAALTMLLLGATIMAGLRWPPAILIGGALIIALDACILLFGRGRYLSLLGQALCAESAARSMERGEREEAQRDRAVRDYLRMKADIDARIDQGEDEGQQPFFEEKRKAAKTQEDASGADGKEEDDVKPYVPSRERKAAPQEVPARRRRQRALTLMDGGKER